MMKTKFCIILGEVLPMSSKKVLRSWILIVGEFYDHNMGLIV